MTDAETILRTVHSVLVVDWPTKDLPETLFRAGYAVVVKGGPEDRYVGYDAADDGSIRRQPIGRPERVDLVHVYRPVEELPGFVTLAVELGATAVWVLSGLAPDGTRDATGCWLPPEASASARQLVETAGLVYLDHPYIADVVRAVGAARAPGAPG
jgi:predicted CoA-binding protein